MPITLSNVDCVVRLCALAALLYACWRHVICRDISITVFCWSRLQQNQRSSPAVRLSEGDEIWHIGSPGLAVYQCRDWWTLAQEVPLGRQNTEGCKYFVALFSYIVRPRAMKFGSVRVWPMDTYSPHFVNFGPGSRDTMRRHASVLHWCTCCKLPFYGHPA